jgi:hypothetical protein
MPCRSDYMEQTNSEKRFQETAKLLVWAWSKYFDHQIPERYRAAAENYYAGNVGQVEELCKLLREAKTRTPRVFNDVLVYNARDPNSRKLATWWEEHEAEDQKRERAEAQAARDMTRFSELNENLSAEDLRILKRYL